MPLIVGLLVILTLCSQGQGAVDDAFCTGKVVDYFVESIYFITDQVKKTDIFASAIKLLFSFQFVNINENTTSNSCGL